MTLHPFGIAVAATHLAALLAFGVLFLFGMVVVRARDLVAGLCLGGAALSESGLILGDVVVRAFLVRLVGPDLSMSLLDVWVIAKPLGHAVVAALLIVGVVRLVRRTGDGPDLEGRASRV